MDFICFQITNSNPEERAALIHRLDLWKVSSIVEESSFIQAFFEADQWRIIEQEFIDYLELRGLACMNINIEDKNWNEEWEKNFQPVLIENRCFVRAPFHEPHADSDIIDLIIEPKLAFGTAHHETTHMMMARMLKSDLSQKSILDFGCGTAILSILAEKMGAHYIKATDNDIKAIENSSHNIQINSCKRIEISKQTLNDLETDIFDIILANINRTVLLESPADLFDLIKKPGRLFISGILKEDEQKLVHRYESERFKLINIQQKGEWLCMEFAS